jgi:antitoxin component YwqK of YwqJK toxin-antitoxin module
MRKNLAIFTILFAVNILFAQQNVTDAKGLKQGYWKKPSGEAGKILYEGMFRDGMPQGVFKYYYPFDTVQAIFDFKKDGKISYAKIFHPNGKLAGKGKYINEYKGTEISNRLKDSVWIYYDDMGVMISKDIYSNGKKNGVCYVYLPDGKVAEEKKFKMDVQDGPFKQYYDGKTVKGEGNYVNGKMEGKNAYYYPNGVAAAVGYYKNGMKTGPWIYKDKDGKVKEKELYIDGQLADKKKTEEFFNKNKVQDTPPKTESKGTKKDTKKS